MIVKNNETISVEIADAISLTRQFVLFNSNESFLNNFVDVFLIFKEESPLSNKSLVCLPIRSLFIMQSAMF